MRERKDLEQSFCRLRGRFAEEKIIFNQLSNVDCNLSNRIKFLNIFILKVNRLFANRSKVLL